MLKCAKLQAVVSLDREVSFDWTLFLVVSVCVSVYDMHISYNKLQLRLVHISFTKKTKQKICVFANEPKNEDQKEKSKQKQKKTSCTRYSLCRYVNLHDYEIEIRAEQKPIKKFNERTDGGAKKVDSNSVSSCSIVINGHEIIIVYLLLLLLLFAACFRCFSIQK